MRKNINKMMEAIAGIPSVDEDLAMEDSTQSPLAELDPGELATPRTGMGVATQAAKLQAKIDTFQVKISNLEARLKEAAESSAAVYIKVDSIEPNPWQPREFFTDEDLDILKTSIKAYGVLSPVAVRHHPAKEGFYQLVAGERRTRAVTQLGLERIPAVILPMTDQEMGAQALAENIVRADLTHYEVGMALSRVQSAFPSKIEMAETFGVSRSQLYRFLTIPKLPQYVLQKIKAAPALFSAALAEELYTALRDDQREQKRPRMEELLNQFVAGTCDQLRLTRELRKPFAPSEASASQTAPTPTPPTKSKSDVTYDGRKIGAMQKDSTTFVIRIKRPAISPDQEAQIQAFFERLFTVKPLN